MYNRSTIDPFHTPIIEEDDDNYNGSDNSINENLNQEFVFGESLKDALASLSISSSFPKLETDCETESGSDISPSTSLASYSFCNSSFSSVASSVQDKDRDLQVENYVEPKGEMKDIMVFDHGTHVVTRTLIRPQKSHSPFHSFSSILSPPPSRSSTPYSHTPTRTHTRTNTPTYTPSHTPSHTPSPTPSVPISRPTSPLAVGLRKVESFFVDPESMLSKSFEEELDLKESQWFAEKLGGGRLEVYMSQEVEVHVEVDIPAKPRRFFGIYTQYMRCDRGLLGPRDQPRRNVFSPPRSGTARR